MNKEFEAYFEMFPDLLYRLDREGKIAYFKSGQQAFVFHDARPEGHNFQEYLPEEIKEPFSASLKRLFEQGIRQNFEFQYDHDNWFEARMGLLNEDEAIVIVRNISRRKKAEKELEKNEKMYRLLASNIPNGAIIIFDPDLNYTIVEGQALELTGYTRQELEGKSIRDTARDEEDYERAKKLCERVLQGEKIVIEQKAGRTGRWFSSTIIPLYNDAHTVVGGMIVAFDINDRKQAEELLAENIAELGKMNEKMQMEIKFRKAIEENLQEYTKELKIKNQELEQFAYVASHDLQEPLRMIASFTQLLAKRYYDKIDADANEYINFALEGTQRMQALINDLLDYSRVGRRNNPDNILNLDEVIEAVLHNLSTKIEETHALVTYDDMPVAKGDRTQTIQLFQNLVANALKFRKENVRPMIHIGIQEKDGQWQICIQDNGIGFEMEHYERIFNIFQRLHTREEFPGTGIGLALCKKIVESHGGSIWATSVPGKGSTFYFTMKMVGKEKTVPTPHA
jgi:PAS domain S-box-containing protein